MIKFQDSLGHKRGIEFSQAHNPKYINLTQFAEKNTNGSTIQFPAVCLADLHENLTQLFDDANSKPSIEHRCSFCGKPRNEVGLLAAGPYVEICNECVGLCVEICMKEGNKKVRADLTQLIKIDEE